MTKARDPDADLMGRLRAKMRTWRAAVESANDERAGVDALIIEAKKSGHSYAQIREVTGFGVATIQMILAKAGLMSDTGQGS